MTKEAVFAFYGLNMTGAMVSLLPLEYADDLDLLVNVIKEEQLTDLILTDFETRAKVVRELMKQKDELGLRHVIILKTEAISKAGSEEVNRIKKRRRIMKKIPDVSFMQDLLIQYEAYPIVYGGGDGVAVTLHKKDENDSSRYQPVEFTDAEINAETFLLAEQSASLRKDVNVLTGLTSDISASYVLIDQLQLTLFTGESLMISYKTRHNESFLQCVGKHHMNVLLLYGSQLQSLIDHSQESGLHFEALNRVFLLGEDIPEEVMEEFAAFFRKHGGNTDISNYDRKRKDYYPDEPLRISPVSDGQDDTEDMAKLAVPAPGIPYAPGIAFVGGKKKKHPMVWEDKIGNSHDMRKVYSRILAALAVGGTGSGKRTGKKANEEDEAGQEQRTKEKLMKMLAVMFEPSNTDYYYED